MTQKVSDLRRMAEERKPRSTNRAMQFQTLERPASRADIMTLEHELEHKLRLILDNQLTSEKDFGTEFKYEPNREQMMVVKDKMRKDLLSHTPQQFKHSLPNKEPWCDEFIQFECIKSLSEEQFMKFSDMLGVSSAEWGSMSRKLRLTYAHAHETIVKSWMQLRSAYLSVYQEIEGYKKQLSEMRHALSTKEAEVSRKFDDELARITREFQHEKDRNAEKLVQVELKNEQMGDTLKYLNGLFRNMQIDGGAVKTVDLQVAIPLLPLSRYLAHPFMLVYRRRTCAWRGRTRI
ncbi:hypothetical protein EON64_10695 [archaeon]|nr:MAG: hypothetical protein EON64_10695 [archaeon]